MDCWFRCCPETGIWSHAKGMDALRAQICRMLRDTEDRIGPKHFHLSCFSWHVSYSEESENAQLYQYLKQSHSFIEKKYGKHLTTKGDSQTMMHLTRSHLSHVLRAMTVSILKRQMHRTTQSSETLLQLACSVGFQWPNPNRHTILFSQCMVLVGEIVHRYKDRQDGQFQFLGRARL